MANPTVTASLSAASYNPGQTMTLTVVYGDADNTSYPLTVTITDASGAVGTAVVQVVTADPVSVKVVDASGKVWTKVSDNGSVAVYTAVA